MKPKETPSKIDYQNRTWEVLVSKDPAATHVILSALDGLRPHQKQLSKKDLQNLGAKEPKKKPGELYILKDSKREYKRGSFILCRNEKERLEKLPEHQKTTFKIE